MEKIGAQCIGVDEIAVVGQGDAVGGIDEKRLSLRLAGGARCGVADMADTHTAQQMDHVPGMEYLSHQAVALVQNHSFPWQVMIPAAS